jgi:hypothetical protein
MSAVLAVLAPLLLPAPAPLAPPPPVSGVRDVPALHAPALHADTPYSIGEPTDEEQLSVELINRARANPAAEGLLLAALTHAKVVSAYTFFNVGLGMLVSESAALSPAPPVSIDPRITQAARLHSADMLARALQTHDGPNGESPGDRLTAAGYVWNTYGENVYAAAEDMVHAHAGFFVDWGPGPGGMQTGRGHRVSIMNPAFREVGVGVVAGVTNDLGPIFITQDFASRPGLTPFITGVVYYDLNTNGVYDLGEGLGGVTITAAGVAGSAVSAGSGGYSLPVPGSDGYQVTFAVPGLAPQTRPATVAGNANVKLDFRPGYVAPVLGGANLAYTGGPNPYVISPVGGATGYEWRQTRRAPWTGRLGAEDGLADFAVETAAGYVVDQTAVKAAGARAYRLAHPEPDPQRLTLLAPLRLGAAPRLVFASRLGWATASQHARVEVSRDDGATWQPAWSRSGSGGAGETQFQTVTVDLAAHAGAVVRVRFSYVPEGAYFPQTDAGVGWYLDEIRFEDAERLTGVQVAAATGGGFDFRPAAEGGYLLAARARTGARLWPWGADLKVEARAGQAPAPPEFVGLRLDDTGRVVFAVKPRAAGAPLLELEAAPAPDGPWSPTGVTVPAAGGEVSLPGPAQPAQFFRLAESP